MRERFAYPMRFTPASEWNPDEAGFVVACRDLPDLVTQGDTEAEALANAAEALEAAIAFRIRNGDDIPAPSRPQHGERLIAAPPLLAAKAALALAMRDGGISRSELARRLGADEKEVHRLLNPEHASRLTALAAALAALGKRLAIDVRDAA